MDIDEVSLVDIPAHQDALVEIAKRHEEGHMPQDTQDEYVDLDQLEEVGVDEAQAGDLVELEDGTVYELTDEDIAELQADVEEHANTPVEVGKAFNQPAPLSGLAAAVREELSKAYTAGDQNEVIEKMAGVVEGFAKRAERAEMVAKGLADRELEGKYTDVAKAYAIPGVDPYELGPVTKRAAETLDEADCFVLAKALRAAGDTYRELGGSGVPDLNDPTAAIAQFVSTGDVAKAFDGLTPEQQVSKAFEMSPGAYDAYLAEYGS